MGIPTVISDLAEVSEALRPHYQQEGDVFVIEVDDINVHPTVVEMKTAHETAKTSKARAKDVHAKLSKLTPELARIDDAFKAKVNSAYREAHGERRRAITALFAEHQVAFDELS